MKQIVVQFDERIYASLKKRTDFRRELGDAVTPPPSMEETVISAILDKIAEGKDRVTVAVPGEPLE